MTDRRLAAEEGHYGMSDIIFEHRTEFVSKEKLEGERMITYILNTEPGTSLKAAGFVLCYRTADVPNGWDRPSRRREPVPQVPKQLWEVRRSKAI